MHLSSKIRQHVNNKLSYPSKLNLYAAFEEEQRTVNGFNKECLRRKIKFECMYICDAWVYERTHARTHKQAHTQRMHACMRAHTQHPRTHARTSFVKKKWFAILCQNLTRTISSKTKTRIPLASLKVTGFC